MGYFSEWEAEIKAHQPYLLAYAYRMTGSLSEAEDMVQDTLLECECVDPKGLENPRAWLTRVCSHKSLDHLKSAYKRRENYKGPWLPDAVPESVPMWMETREDDERTLILKESLRFSFLLLAERLSPEERAVYLLSEVFDYSFAVIADFLGKSEAACRKLAERARKSMQEGRKKFAPLETRAEDLLRTFFELAKLNDKERLRKLLSEESEFWSDGGGKVGAAKTMRDVDLIVNFFTTLWLSESFANGAIRSEFRTVNACPGIVFYRRQGEEWLVDTVMTIESKDGLIQRLFTQRNPDRIQAWAK